MAGRVFLSAPQPAIAHFPIKDAKTGGTTHRVHITQLGVYIRDSYDFNDDQPLGNWGPDEVRMMPSPRLAMVENASFRRWRREYKRGGDFIIFSDVRWEPVPQGLIWEYTV